MNINNSINNINRKIKLLIIDLDNTLWDGILLEDGLAGIKLKPGWDDIIKTLDARGILLSIISKNDPDLVFEALKKFNFKDYFLFPQINWNPKSDNLEQLQKIFNIGIDTIAFIDDAEFERFEVFSRFPLVLILKAEQYKDIIYMPEFIPDKISNESSQRRFLYKQQGERFLAEKSFNGRYVDFLKSCQLIMETWKVKEENLERISELIERSNQLNVTNAKYTLQEVIHFYQLPTHHMIAMHLKDKFGDYGLTGACIIYEENKIWKIQTLAFSCRVCILF